jgi:hypothetical protein
MDDMKKERARTGENMAILDKIITIDESVVLFHKPETKHQSR